MCMMVFQVFMILYCVVLARMKEWNMRNVAPTWRTYSSIYTHNLDAHLHLHQAIQGPRQRALNPLVNPNIRFPPRGIPHRNTPSPQAIVDANVMHEPASKTATYILFGSIKKHKLLLGGEH